MKKRSAAPWSLPKLLATDRNAATVHAALLYLANGRRRLGVTRGRLRDVCGLSERINGAAVESLHNAGWIKRTYARDAANPVRTWFRILLRKCDFVSCGTKNDTQEKSGSCRKTTHRKTFSCGTKNDTPPHRGVGAVPASAPNVAAAPARPDTEHPSARKERERLARARTEREASEQAEERRS